MRIPFHRLICGPLVLLTTSALAVPPVAIDDSLQVAVDASVTADLRLNDYDADGDALIITGTSSPSSGALVENGNGSFTYTPNPAFVGDDSFSYDLSDGVSTVSATVSISVNANFDPGAARAAILAGVTSLTNPVQPGHMVIYGPTAHSVSNYPGENLDDPMIAAATRGSGRIIALPDHQWLNLDSHGSDPSMSTFYLNSIAWLAESPNLGISIVTYDDSASASWLVAQGFTDVTNASAVSLAGDLVGADVFVAGWLGSNVSSTIIQTVGDAVRDGVGLLIADYGVGYDWWWGQEAEDIPGNRILRPAGIGFSKDWPHGSGTQAVSPAVGQVTAADILNLVANWTSATQADLDLGAAVMTKLNGVLATDDTLRVAIDAQILASSSTLVPTPSTPISGSFEKSLLGWESTMLHNVAVADTVIHRTALPVGATAPRISTTRTLNVPDGHPTIYIPTGLYAAPGEIVTVTLPLGFQSVGLRARISHLRTDLGDTNFYHMPHQQFHFDLDASSVQIASPYGGLISIEAASGEDGITNAQLQFDNVVEAPYYVHGVTTDNEWNNGIRDRETPFGVLVTDKTIHVIESEAHLRDLSDPNAVMQIWEDMILHIQEFYSYTTYRPLRVHHDYQPAGGFSTFPQSYSINAVLLDYKELVNFGYPLTHHEYGHIVDPSQMIFQNFSEASPNFGGIYASRFFGPFTYRPKGSQERIRRYENPQSTNLWSTPPHTLHHEKITPFISLADAFGWNELIDVIAALKLTSPANDQEKIDNWLTLYGAGVGHDVSPFFALWQLSPSATALNAVSALPQWNMVETVEDRLIVHRDSFVTFPSPAENDFSYDGSLTLVGVTAPLNGTLTELGNGNFQYVPDPGFFGFDSFDYTVVNGTGNSFVASVPITVVTEADSPKLHVGVALAQTGSWTVVDLPYDYSSPVIIAQQVQGSGQPSMVTRVRNVQNDSFELLLQRVDGSAAPVLGVTVNYVVAEEGVYTEEDHGLKMEAVLRLSTTTDTTENLVGETFEPQWNTLEHYTLPAFFGQVMSTNDLDWSTWWSRANSQAIVAGKQVGGDSDTTRADEVLGYIALESGTVQLQQTYMRFGDTQSDLLQSVSSGGTTLRFPREPQLTAAIVQATGLEENEKSYWSVLTDTAGYLDNEVGVVLRNDAGFFAPSERAGYLVAAHIRDDCDSDGVPDFVEITSGTANDCNENGIPDSCDIAAGRSSDSNGNSVLDECEARFQRGDVNVDGHLDIGDIVATLGYLFATQPVACELAVDMNDDGILDIADPMYALAYFFVGNAPAPPAPFLQCGPDSTPGGSLTCDSFSLCP